MVEWGCSTLASHRVASCVCMDFIAPGSESISTGGGAGDAISEDHYFAKNTELRVWLLETKKVRHTYNDLISMSVFCAYTFFVRVCEFLCLTLSLSFSLSLSLSLFLSCAPFHLIPSLFLLPCPLHTLQIYFDDLNADEGRTWFKQFVVAWNTGKLASKFYKGIDHSQQSAAERTKFKWGFAKKMTDDDVDALSSARDSVDTQTFHQVTHTLSLFHTHTHAYIRYYLPSPLRRGGPT
jgi:hypothetical protein